MRLLEARIERDVSTILETFRPAFQAAGSPWSAARLAGTFGHAFAFGMNEDTGPLWQTAAIDYFHFYGELERLGHEALVLAGSSKGPRAIPGERIRELKERAWTSVRASIDRGVPAVAWSPMTRAQREAGSCISEWALLVGYDEARRVYFVRHRSTDETREVPYDGFGHVDPVEYFCVIVLGGRKQTEGATRHALENAIAFGKGKRTGGTKFSTEDVDAAGVKALELWLGAFRKKKVQWDAAPGHADFLCRARRHAAAYLSELAGELGESSALSDATRLYGEVVAGAEELGAACRVRDEARSIAALTNILQSEREAVGRLEVVAATAR